MSGAQQVDKLGRNTCTRPATIAFVYMYIHVVIGYLYLVSSSATELEVFSVDNPLSNPGSVPSHMCGGHAVHTSHI